MSCADVFVSSNDFPINLSLVFSPNFSDPIVVVLKQSFIRYMIYPEKYCLRFDVEYRKNDRVVESASHLDVAFETNSQNFRLRHC